MYAAPESQLHSDREREMELAGEIATLEQRLHSMGMDGDCAYERAISKLYHSMIEERKQQLAELRLSPSRESS